jgi:hypothetical protein
VSGSLVVWGVPCFFDWPAKYAAELAMWFTTTSSIMANPAPFAAARKSRSAAAPPNWGATV